MNEAQSGLDKEVAMALGADTDFLVDIPFRQVADHINQVLYVTDVKHQRVLYVNPAYETIWNRSCASALQDRMSFVEAIHPDDRARVAAAVERQLQGEVTNEEYRIFQSDAAQVAGEVRWILDRCFPVRNVQGEVYRVVGIAEDITQQKQTELRLREQSYSLERVLNIGQTLVAELDLTRLVQAVTDAARELCGAQFGAFFYNVDDPEGKRYTLYTLSGASFEAFANYPMPRATEIFGPTFRSEGTLRSDDIRQDSRYGKSAPHFGMPKGHLPVVSYLAVPVISRSGEVLGGLFYSHDQVGVFTAEKARLVELLAAQAAIAVDNARLFELVQSERATARANEQDYRFLAASIPGIVWVANPSGDITYFNQRWNEYTGQNPNEGKGWGWQGVIHPADLIPCTEHWQAAMANSSTFEFEYRLRRASDGIYRWHLGRAVPLRDDNDQIVKWFGTATDIHEQKSLQEGLKFLSDAGAVLSSSLEYQETVNSLVRLAVPNLCDWCVVDVEENGNLKRLAVAHQDPEKVQLGFDFMERYPPRREDINGVYHVLSTGESQLVADIPEAAIEAAAQDEAMLKLLKQLGLRSAMIVPLKAHGQIIGVMTLVNSESGRLFGEKDLILAEELARRAGEAVYNARLYREAQDALLKAQDSMRARDEFLAIVSHELKTPLTPVLGWVSMLQKLMQQEKSSIGAAPDGTIEHALQVIERNVRIQSQLINDLLDVSRIITGKMHLNLRPVVLQPIIEAALETVRPTATAKTIEIRTHFEQNVGQCQGDPDRLQQIVWNLVANAIKFTPKGGLVEVFLTRQDSALQIMVRDTGNGIEANFLPFIFDRFQQADSSTTRNYGGLGLGLSIVRHLMEMHGGTISVESPGTDMGSTFRLSLPMMAVVPAEPGQPETESPARNDMEAIHSLAAQTSRTLLQGLRILLVEDEADARDLISVVLQGYGAEVRAAVSASEGFEMLQQWRPDLMVSDIGMPDEDGYSLIKRVRALSPDQGGKTPAVALTAYARMEDRFKALSSGFQNHLAKPVEPAELALTVASVLGRANTDS